MEFSYLVIGTGINLALYILIRRALAAHLAKIEAKHAEAHTNMSELKAQLAATRSDLTELMATLHLRLSSAKSGARMKAYKRD